MFTGRTTRESLRFELVRGMAAIAEHKSKFNFKMYGKVTRNMIGQRERHSELSGKAVHDQPQNLSLVMTVYHLLS